jgi:hypothetical protein
MHLNFIAETSWDGVVDRSFTVGEVPGVLWSPACVAPGARFCSWATGVACTTACRASWRARQAVVRDRFHVAGIDAPGLGDRARSHQDQRWVDALLRAREEGEPFAPIIAPFNSSLAERAAPEWRTTADARQSLPEIGADEPIGGGFVYADVPEAARRVTIPIEFLLPWGDAEIDRESGLALFDTFASEDKTLHGFPGSHFRLPAERIDTRFFARQLGNGAAGASASS